MKDSLSVLNMATWVEMKPLIRPILPTHVLDQMRTGYSNGFFKWAKPIYFRSFHMKKIAQILKMKRA